MLFATIPFFIGDQFNNIHHSEAQIECKSIHEHNYEGTIPFFAIVGAVEGHPQLHKSFPCFNPNALCRQSFQKPFH